MVWEGSSDGCTAIACRQALERRFCRRSQLSNTRSHRRPVVSPGYGLGWWVVRRRYSERLPVAVLSTQWFMWVSHALALTTYRLLPLSTAAYQWCITIPPLTVVIRRGG